MSAQIIRNTLIVATLAAFAAAPAFGQGFGPEVARYVDHTATGDDDGLTWEDAYDTLQEALADAVGNSDITVINVAEGTYKPGTTSRSDKFVLPNHKITLLGGYPNTGGTRDPANNPTILSGDIDGDGTPDADNSYTVLYADDHDTGDIIIDGFTFTLGYARESGGSLHQNNGGAIFIYNSSGGAGNITINDCIFDTNEADEGGGAVFIREQAAVITITDCLFDGNKSAGGGGVKIAGPHGETDVVQIGGQGEGCTFTANVAGDGGALQLHNRTVEIEYCTFEDNQALASEKPLSGATGGAIEATIWNDNDHTFTAAHCTFDGNLSDDDEGDQGYGGAVAIKGFDVDATTAATFSNCDFLYNETSLRGGAVLVYTAENLGAQPPFTHYSGPTLFQNCQFTGNSCDYDGVSGTGDSGGAIWGQNVDITCTGTDFDNNEAEQGGGAIWINGVFLGDGSQQYPLRHFASLTLTNCDFRGNVMTSTTASGGGGAVFLEGQTHDTADRDTEVDAEITNCGFFDNEADRGGGIYLHSTRNVHITTSRFVGNDGRKAGGGIGVGDPDVTGITETRICKSRFVSNTSDRGGAIHNHEDAVTWIVNCRLVGNHSDLQGGAAFNSRHTSGSTAELYMHNCIIAGNEASNSDSQEDSDMGGGVYTGFGTDTAVTELVHCTLIGNYAEYQYGGAVTKSEFSVLKLRNTINWDNADGDGGTDALDAQLFYATDALDDDYVDNNVIDQLNSDPTRFDHSGNEVNTHLDPVFSDEGSTTLDWNSASYADGVTTFVMDEDPGSAGVGMLFQPYPGETYMLLIKEVDTVNDRIHCWGVLWSDNDPQTPISAKLYDLHIDDTGSAEDWGDATYIGPPPNGAGDVCDLDGNPTTNTLPYDLDTVTPNGRNQNTAPDAGVYEIPN